MHAIRFALKSIKLIPSVAKVCKKETKEIKGSIYTVKESIICLFQKDDKFRQFNNNNNDNIANEYYTNGGESRQKRRLIKNFMLKILKSYTVGGESRQKRRLKHNLSFQKTTFYNGECHCSRQ